MARYIDADKLIEALQTDYDREGAKADEMAIMGLADASVKYSHGQFCYLNAIEQVKDCPTADVVPKSEVEEAVKKVVGATDKVICEAKAEVAREIFEEIEETFIDSSALPDCARFVDIDKFAELKKKYAEGK